MLNSYHNILHEGTYIGNDYIFLRYHWAWRYWNGYDHDTEENTTHANAISAYPVLN